MNLAFRFPIIYWNCACLISDAGGDENEEENDIVEDLYVENIEYDNSLEDFSSEIDDDEEEDEEEIIEKKKKKKTKTTNFGKIATAIGKMKTLGIEVSPPDINKSTFTFSPDEENNIIRYGLSGLTRIGEELIQSIILNRPYKNLEDFVSKNKVNKLQMVALIKSGAFDSFGDSRRAVMYDYIVSISDTKKRITLQNMAKLIEYNLLPEEFSFQCKVFNFNKYIKKFKEENYFILDEIALKFYEENFDIDNLIFEEKTKISQVKWKTIYEKEMDKIRNYIKPNQQLLLDKMNNLSIQMMWNKYCLGSEAHWEMESASCYFKEHELKEIDLQPYGVKDYGFLSENPTPERTIMIKGKQVILYRIDRIAGVILDKDKSKKTLTLLTTTGVATVKIYGDAFSHYDKQISEKLPNGKKKVIEKSMFKRGNLIVVTGIRRGSEFVAKKYSATPYHLVEKIELGENDFNFVTR